MNTRTGLLVILLLFLATIGITLYLMPDSPASSIPAAQENGDRIFEDDTASYTITARYPALPLGADASAGANAEALATLEAWVATTTDEFRAFAQSLPDEEKARIADTGRKYELGIAYIPYSSGAIRSVEFDIYMDTGGAHPNAFFRTFIFDENGKALPLAGLFAEGTPFLPVLAEKTETQVRAQLAERLGEDGEAMLFEEGLTGEAANFENVVLDGTDLVILIPPYQAAAYAAGTFTVRIPLEELRTLLNAAVFGE